MAVMAPQSECPQITTSCTPNTATAYSTVAETPPPLRPIGRHDVAGIADDEHLARLLLGHQFGYDAAVRAGNEQRPGRLRMRQLVEQLGPLLVSRLADFKNPATRSFMAWPSSIFRLDSWATAGMISKTMFLRTSIGVAYASAPRPLPLVAIADQAISRAARRCMSRSPRCRSRSGSSRTRCPRRTLSGERQMDSPWKKAFIIEARKNLLPVRDRLIFFKDEQEFLPGITAIAAPGHTLGHTMFNVQSNGQSLFFVGDVSHHSVLLIENPRMKFSMIRMPSRRSRRGSKCSRSSLKTEFQYWPIISRGLGTVTS